LNGEVNSAIVVLLGPLSQRVQDSFGFCNTMSMQDVDNLGTEIVQGVVGL